MHGIQAGQELPLWPTDVKVLISLLDPRGDPRLGDGIDHLGVSSLGPRSVITTASGSVFMGSTAAMTESGSETGNRHM